jgi:hypothetical protein
MRAGRDRASNKLLDHGDGSDRPFTQHDRFMRYRSEFTRCIALLRFPSSPHQLATNAIRINWLSGSFQFTNDLVRDLSQPPFQPRARESLSSNTLIVLGNLLVVLVYVLMALVRQRELFLGVAALAGAGWTLSAAELWVAAQRAMPSWARGRMNATVIMVSQGAIALGGIVWGYSSQAAGVNVTLIVAAVAMAFSLLLAIPLSINFTKALSFDPPPISCVMMPLVSNPQPRDGPVAITFEIEVDRMRGREFLELMREVRLIHRRNGAFSWRLDEDLTRSNIYRIEMLVPSWTGYLRQRERLTKAEQETINKVWRLHVGEDVPEERYYLCVNRELDVRGTTVTHPSNMSIRSLDPGARVVQRTSRATLHLLGE